MGGTVVFAAFAAIYFWWPKVTGRFLSERLGRWHFALLFVGFNMTFLVMHVLGRDGMPRRVADYEPQDGITTLNTVASIGAFVLAVSFIPFIVAIWRSLRTPRTAGADPWHGYSLEWATSSPPPLHNFDWLPPIRSERPVFDLRWLDDPEHCNVAAVAAWDARRDSDPRWRSRSPGRPETTGRAP
jgi:cytochrome c oxidase subunit 1